MSSPRRFTLVPPLERFPSVVRRAQSVPGKLAILAVFALGLALHGRPWWLEMTALVGVIAFLPERRRLLVALGSLVWLAARDPFHWGLARRFAERCGVSERINWAVTRPAAVLAVLVFCFGFHLLLQRSERAGLVRRPIACVLALLVLLLGSLSQPALPPLVRVALFTFTLVLVNYVWYLAYSAVHREQVSPWLAVGRYSPFWMVAANATPIPKGAGYLDRIESRGAEELAVCQLKALKLLFWAGLLSAVRRIAVDCVDGTHTGPLSFLGVGWDLDLPTSMRVLAASAAGERYPTVVGVAALAVDFADRMLLLVVWGHVVVACVRAVGYKALRNTWRPLESRSIADFWNRYFFYFKELLVDVFFYPAYMRWFRKADPRVRRFAATLAAATFGNFLFHFVRDLERISTIGLWQGFLARTPYLVYCFLLGAAIGVSQLRAKRDTSGEHWTRRRLLRPAIVLSFYCLLEVFEIPGPAGVAERFELLFSWVGGRA